MINCSKARMLPMAIIHKIKGLGPVFNEACVFCNTNITTFFKVALCRKHYSYFLQQIATLLLTFVKCSGIADPALTSFISVIICETASDVP